MNATRLLEHFDRVAEAPGAVPHLRRFILGLAMRGKLVEQNPRDEPATDIIHRILADAETAMPDEARVASNDGISDLPPGWTRIALATAAHIEMGQSPSSEHYNNVGQGLPFYQGKADFGDRYPKPRWWCTSPTKLAKKGDVLISVRAPVGPTNIADQDCCIGRGLAALRPRRGVDLDFLLLSLRALAPALAALGFGTTFEAINKRHLTSFAIPLAPLSEQHRIVTRVNELMALCDRLEAAQAERETRRDRVVVASLQRLDLQAVDKGQLSPDVQFSLNQLRTLTSSFEHVKKLRDTILQLGVRGLLARNDSDERPALTALKGGANSQRPTASPNVPRNAIPANWIWTTIDHCFEVSGGVQKTPQRRPVSHHYPYVGVANVHRGRLDLSLLKRFELTEAEMDKLRLKTGDLLVVEGNGSPNEIGRCALWNGEITDCAHQNHIIRCRPADPEISPFILRYLNSPDGIALMKALAVTSSGLYNLSVGKIRSIPIPLPPLAEQHRIVAKVDELMAVCDKLEAQITGGEATNSRLLDALLHEALGGSAAVA